MVDRVDFRPSGGFLLLTALSPLLVLVLAAWGLVRSGGPGTGPIILLVIGLVLAGVALFDVPHRVVVDGHGVTRRCVLRRQVFAWDDIRAFRRPRQKRGRRRVGEGPGAPTPGDGVEAGKGGLLVETKARRQYLLSFGRERPDTYGGIEEMVRRHAPGLSMPGPPHYARTDGRS